MVPPRHGNKFTINLTNKSSVEEKPESMQTGMVMMSSEREMIITSSRYFNLV